MDGTPNDETLDAQALAEDVISLGSEMRQVRKARQLTLKSVARETGISLSHLSAIERGATNPSLDVVYKVAQALDIEAEWFFARRPGSGPMERAYVVRKSNRRNLNTLYREDKDEIGLTDELLSSSIAGQLLMGVAEYEPHSERPGHTIYQHQGEQHGYVLEGQLELQITEERITLREGDSFSFPTEILHNAINRTDRPAKLIWAISPIVIPKDVVVDPSGGDVTTPTKDAKTGDST
ncbi:MAG: XRE family transcriptional regulator [Pseudomonadota bacterium]